MDDKGLINKKAYFNYQIIDKYVAGIILLGTEVKSVRENKLSFNDSFCLLIDSELYIRALHIGPYSLGTTNNHVAVHDRKLLLTRKELNKIEKNLLTKGHSIVPLRIFFSDKNLLKIEIGIGKGKKIFDKRETIKKRENDLFIKKQLAKNA